MDGRVQGEWLGTFIGVIRSSARGRERPLGTSERGPWRWLFLCWQRDPNGGLQARLGQDGTCREEMDLHQGSVLLCRVPQCAVNLEKSGIGFRRFCVLLGHDEEER